MQFILLKQAPDAVPRGLRGWGSKKDNMEIIWEVRHVQAKTSYKKNSVTESKSENNINEPKNVSNKI